MSGTGPLIKGISAELQDEILSLLIFNRDVYSATEDVINPKSFYGDDYKVLMIALTKFHKKNKATPTLKDMMIEVQLYLTIPSEIQKVKKLLLQLHDDYVNEYQYKEDLVVRAHVEEFVRRNGMEQCIADAVASAKEDQYMDWDRIMKTIGKYYNYAMVQSEPYNMGDVENIQKVHEEALGTGDATKKIRLFIDEINVSLNQKALMPGTLTMICAAPGTGKTMFMIDQGVSATVDGFYSLHVFLGDLNKNSARLRYLAAYSQVPLSELNEMSIEEQTQLTAQTNQKLDGALSRNFILSLPAGELSVEGLFNEIDKIQTKNRVLDPSFHFHQIMIDYDANIKSNSESMYDAGAEVYNYVRNYGERNSSVMLIASQPKVSNYNSEVITLEAAAESSRKQNIIDLMIGLGKPAKIKSSLGLINIPKNRDGIENVKVPLFRDGARQTMHPIDVEDYERRKHDAMQAEFAN